MILPISLTAVGGAALINAWLAIRCGQVRTKEKVLVGDGGNDLMIRRMRAHSNFTEFAPIVLILIAVIEYSLGTANVGWLWYVMALFLLGRVAHGFGMDGWGPGRPIGALTALLATVGLGLYALAIPHLNSAEAGNAPVEVGADSTSGVEEVPAE